jgi:serine/threonine protein kinase
MKNMLNKDPAKRFQAHQVINHHWFIKMRGKEEQNQR